MKLEQDKVGLFHYVLKDKDGNQLDASQETPLAYVHGYQNLIPGLEKELAGKAVGDKFSVTVPANEAYGERDENMVQAGIPKNLFQGVENLEVGMRFEAQSEQGVHSVEVIEIEDETVTVDANHPMAGKDLTFDIEISGIRDATEEELEHGHAHGDGGHHH